MVLYTLAIGIMIGDAQSPMQELSLNFLWCRCLRPCGGEKSHGKRDDENELLQDQSE